MRCWSRRSRGERELNSTSHELQWAHLTIQKKDAVIQLLEERLRKQRIGFLGPASETLSDLQLELLVEEEPSTTREEVEAESRREPIRELRASANRIRAASRCRRICRASKK